MPRWSQPAPTSASPIDYTAVDVGVDGARQSGFTQRQGFSGDGVYTHPGTPGWPKPHPRGSTGSGADAFGASRGARGAS